MASIALLQIANVYYMWYYMGYLKYWLVYSNPNFPTLINLIALKLINRQEINWKLVDKSVCTIEITIPYFSSLIIT